MELVPKDRWPAKKPVATCPDCRRTFGITIWKHHCHACGKVICAECSGKRALPPTYQEPVLVCRDCESIARAVYNSGPDKVAPPPPKVVGGKPIGGPPSGPLDAAAERERRAQVAEERIKAQQLRGTGNRPDDASNDPTRKEKQELLGRIRAQLARTQTEEPFGLATMTNDRLRSYLQDLQTKSG